MNGMLKATITLAAIAFGLLAAPAIRAEEPVDPGLAKRFEYLSENGNSNCSRTFMESIATMAPTSRLQGSCCSPMSLHRYSEQVTALRKYKDIAEIPPDAYDIEAGLAQKLMASYDAALTPDQQRAYAYAMANADEKGPCCCQCWRWKNYGGLAKLLIRERGFTGEQITEVWNLSDGCGGDDEHLH